MPRFVDEPDPAAEQLERLLPRQTESVPFVQFMESLGLDDLDVTRERDLGRNTVLLHRWKGESGGLSHEEQLLRPCLLAHAGAVPAYDWPLRL